MCSTLPNTPRAGLGAGAYYVIGGVAGGVVGGLLAVLGLYLGLRLANHARRTDQLVEFAHGLSPRENTPIPQPGTESTNADHIES